MIELRWRDAKISDWDDVWSEKAAVPVREVTPQDEQDRLKFRENTCNDALNYPPN